MYQLRILDNYIFVIKVKRLGCTKGKSYLKADLYLRVYQIRRVGHKSAYLAYPINEGKEHLL